MIRFLFRFLGLVTLAAAFVFVIRDGMNLIANQSLEFMTVGELWSRLDQTSLLLFQPAIERHVAPWLWQSLIQPFFLEQPVSLVLLILGALLILLGRKKKPLIGYAR